MRRGGGLLFLRKGALSSAAIVALFALGIASLPYEWLGRLLTGFRGSDRLNAMLGIAGIRIAGFAIAVVAARSMRFSVFAYRKHDFWRSLLFCAPFFLVVVNNAPWIALIGGQAVIDASAGEIVAFCVECLFVAAFEETALRGIVLPLALIGCPKTRAGTFWALMYSSAIFGLMHLVNLLAGAGIGAVAMQIGYAFLCGCMCGLVVLRTRNLWLAILLHFLFNFGGLVIDTLGAPGSELWDTPTIVLTVVIAVAATAYGIRRFLRLDLASVRAIYEDPTEDAAASSPTRAD